MHAKTQPHLYQSPLQVPSHISTIFQNEELALPEKSYNCSLCEPYFKDQNKDENIWIKPKDIHETFHSQCEKCSAQSVDDDLCTICSHLRIPHLLQCTGFENNQIFSFYFGTLQELGVRSSSCRFCRLINNACHTEFQCNRVDYDLTWSVRVMKEQLYGDNSVTWVVFCVIDNVPPYKRLHLRVSDPAASSYLYRPPPAVMGEFVEWKRVRSWLNQKLSSDEDKENDVSRKPQTLDDSGKPQNLKLIDVLEDRVVYSPEKSEYLALSYVFGGVTTIELPSSGCFERTNLPATIQDSLVACDKLGYRYLWIDQLCIDQTNAAEVQEQINQMDRIYQYARCTLVALGEDSNHGLSGVTRPRSWQNSITQIGDIVFGNQAPNLTENINNSKWWTRGWTLQEAFYSPKLFFFTRYGVYYSQWPSFEVRSETICNEEYTPQGVNYWTIVDQYTKRNLSYQSDILRAFTAVLRATHGDGTYYGLPVDYIDQAVAWTPEDLDSSQIRDGFPSWSWASHVGPTRHLRVHAGLALWAIPHSKTAVTICKPPTDDDKNVLEVRWDPSLGDLTKIGAVHELSYAFGLCSTVIGGARRFLRAQKSSTNVGVSVR
ncbi:heterokaryon incompatibility protein-domain-containing protein [Aspergillus tamarii]|uniref:Heterokaryon incompatibility protein-domain-containing protein n=1 Tax=Aspergillus tamarii TaxID=41984 RepID=A0A5N6VCK7_ASPTM|nr:heterokaryon incompatibility protein-domain-containing protein [Aspergillus tamarii]